MRRGGTRPGRGATPADGLRGRAGGHYVTLRQVSMPSYEPRYLQPPRRQPATVYRRRRLAAIGALLLAVLAVASVVAAVARDDAAGTGAAGAGSGAKGAVAKGGAADKPRRPTLPDGTRSIFPEHRVVAFY